MTGVAVNRGVPYVALAAGLALLLPLPAASAGDTNAPAVSAEVLGAWQKAEYRFAPEVEAAFLADARATALKKVADAGKILPADFLAWIDADPVVRTTAYGARRDASGILLMLRSLELDLGTEAVRKTYTQLALAAAVVHAKDGAQADLSPRAPLALEIGGDPRTPADTRAKDRPLDLNDHILNFLDSHTLEEDVVIGQREEPPELKYDDKGVAIPAPKKKGKPKMVPVTERRTRTLYAADVIASRALQEQFNACMKEKGQAVRIDCGDRVVHWNSHDMVRGEQNRRIAEAFRLFRTAYEAKGRLPVRRDPIPSPAENCAYLIRNDRHRFPAELQAQRKWPRYPLTAPWPTLTLLVENNQPLREREERWLAFRDQGEFKTYGEYIGGIAQQFDMQSARRLRDFPFTYGTIQMMLKDGGVCGTMAGISVRSHGTLGVPASTAGQPGHCALVLFAFDPKTGTYACRGAQYATAGDAGTHVHAPWVFGDVDARRPMVYHQSVAWSVNHGLQAFLDATAAHALYHRLPEDARKAHGADLLRSAIALAPYNLLLVDDAAAGDADPAGVVGFWKTLKPALASNRPGCPADGLYPATVKDKLFARLAALPVPADPAQARAIRALLEEEQCANQAALAAYRVAADGLPAVLAATAAAFTNHLASARTDAACAAMADELAAVAGSIADKAERARWTLARWQEIQGHELYFGRRNELATDPSLKVLAKLAGRKPRDANAQTQTLLDGIAGRLKAETAAPRTPQGSKELAGLISAAARQVKDDTQRRQWLEALAKIIAGREQYEHASGKRMQTLRDPCADVIAQLREEPR